MHVHPRITGFITLVAICGGLTVTNASAVNGPEKWFYAHIDLLQDTQSKGASFGTTDLIGLMPDLQKHGYSVLVLQGYHLLSIDRLSGKHETESETFLSNLHRLKDSAKTYNLEIIPAIMPVGSSGEILINNPNLAEGMPARKVPLTVHEEDGSLTARLSDRTSRVREGLIEGIKFEHRQRIAEQWDMEPDDFVFSEDTMSGEGTSMHIQNVVDHPFLKQYNVSLEPGRQYLWSFEFRSKKLVQAPGDHTLNLYSIVEANDPLLGKRKLHHVSHPIPRGKETDTWVRFDVSLNSFEYGNATVHIGLDSAESGEIWLDNIKLIPTLGVNVLRRPDLPVSLRRADGSKLIEGRDFKYWHNPIIGDYGLYLPTDCAGSVKLLATAGVKANDRLSIDYYHAALPNRESHRVCCSMLHPDVLQIHRENVRLLERHLQPKRWFINHDEIRSCCHGPEALAQRHTPATLLRQHLIECLKIIRDDGGGKPVILNGDMYDPYHNAVRAAASDKEGSYFPFVNGDFTGSWLPITDRELPNRPPITVWNWNFANGDPECEKDRARQLASFRHFQSLGYSQIIGGYYDPESKPNARVEGLFRIAKESGVPISGVCYYTAKQDATFLESFAKSADLILKETPR